MNKQVLIIVIFLFCYHQKSFSQIDPELAALIRSATNNYKKTASSQEKAMMLIEQGHILSSNEIKKARSWQEDFNNYLDSFSSLISYAAEIYGFYFEIEKLEENLKEFSLLLTSTNDDLLSFYLIPQKNSIYSSLMLESIDIINDVRLYVLSKNKTTQKERALGVLRIRPKLLKINSYLKNLNLSIKYNSLGNNWKTLSYKQNNEKINKENLSLSALRKWKENVKTKK